MRGLGRIHALAGEKQQAIDALTAALEHYRGAGDDYYAPLLLNDLGELYASLGERGQAFELYEQALRLEQRMGSRATEAQTLYLIGQWHAAAGALDAVRVALIVPAVSFAVAGIARVRDSPVLRTYSPPPLAARTRTV